MDLQAPIRPQHHLHRGPRARSPSLRIRQRHGSRQTLVKRPLDLAPAPRDETRWAVPAPDFLREDIFFAFTIAIRVVRESVKTQSRGIDSDIPG